MRLRTLLMIRGIGVAGQAVALILVRFGLGYPLPLFWAAAHWCFSFHTPLPDPWETWLLVCGLWEEVISTINLTPMAAMKLPR